MICDYYNVSLRYPIIHNASRSMIQNYKNGNTRNIIYYPLFKMSLVEKEMLETGLDLLKKDVDCICYMLMSNYDNQDKNKNNNGKGEEQINILAKLYNLFQYLLRDNNGDDNNVTMDWRSESFYESADEKSTN